MCCDLADRGLVPPNMVASQKRIIWYNISPSWVDVMKLHIENFAKISSADLEFDGLTVVAGDNNTGKSTVGKVLYAIFRALSQLDKRVFRDRIQTIQRAFRQATNLKLDDVRAKRLLTGQSSLEMIYDEVRKDRMSYDEFELLFMAAVKEKELSDFAKEDIGKSIHEAQATKSEVISANLAYKVLDCVFHHQILPLRKTDKAAKLVLTVQGVDTEISIQGKKVSFLNGTDLIKKARLISSPDVLSLMNIRGIESDPIFQRVFDKYTLELAQELIRESRLSVTAQEAIQNRLTRIFNALSMVKIGEITHDEDNDFAVLEDGNDVPTKVENLSMGMKFFVLLHMMLRQGVLQDKDILILDEPENHLHPEWQVVYAHVLVLLQKEFQLSVLVTSHSQFFVNALQRFAISEDIMADTHFYMSKLDDSNPGLCTFSDVTNNAGQIFRSFNRAYDKMSRMSKEFSGEDESS